MLRRFYELRDASGPQEHLRNKPLARKRQAGAVLASLVASSADSIHGGLFDPSVQSALPVEALLLLLGEALIFVNQEKRVLGVRQAFALLRAVEDISTVTAGVSKRCEEWFRAALEDVRRGGGSGSNKDRDRNGTGTSTGNGADNEPPPRLIQSTSSLTGSSAFSLIGASGITSGSGSGELVKLSRSESQLQESSTNEDQPPAPRRAWDWRRGLHRDARPQDVLTILRLGLAKEVSVLWTEDV